MSMQKRSSASSSSSESNQLKKQCPSPIKQETSCSMEVVEEVVQRAMKKVLEDPKSHSAKCCQSCPGNPSEEMKKQIQHLTDSVRQLTDSVWQQKEAIELATVHCPHLRRFNTRSTENNNERKLQLQLQTKLSFPEYTGKRLEGENGTPISIALIDANTGGIVTSGPESSINLSIVVLEGNFDKDNGDNWAPEEFEKYEVKERKGKGSLLIGDTSVTLKEGLGELGQLKINDNSSWTSSKTFRIGLKVPTGYCGSTRIREAKTEAFRVKESRGEASEKHYPPASDDDVWRLNEIARNGKHCQKLREKEIHKVEDFLLQLFTGPEKLREMLGKMSKEQWDNLVSHAKTCKTKWRIYFYYPDCMRKEGAVFNTDNVLIGRIQDKLYYALQRLSVQDKEYGYTIRENATDIWEFNGETFSQVRQAENLTPVQHYLAPPISAPPVGLEAPLANAGSTAEGHTMDLSVDAYWPTSPDHYNDLVPPGDYGIAAVGFPMQSHDINTPSAIRGPFINSSSQTDNPHQNVLPSEQPYASMSGSRNDSTPHPIYSDDFVNSTWANNDDRSF